MPSNSPTVTVIIATYNKSDVLRYAIESVLWQTFDDFELWVVGDYCTDDSEQVVYSYNDHRVNWYNLPQNSGYQSKPHNEALCRAKGNYIAYLNHDDIWLPNHLRHLVDGIKKTEADFVFSILEVITSWAPSYPRIPDFPDAPRPPEASATLHRKDVVDDIGYWKNPNETYFTPRAEYFRRAQFMGKKFQLVPFLTVLKFGYGKNSYKKRGAPLHAEYIKKVRNEPDFAHKELAEMLINANHELERLITPKRLIFQVSESLRRVLVKKGIEPGQVRFWQKPGKYVRDWHKRQGVNTRG